jgi:hypothetical protein
MAGGAWGERKMREKITNQTSYLASLAADLAPSRLLSWKWGWLWWTVGIQAIMDAFLLLLLSRKLGGRGMCAKIPGMVY